MDTQSVKTFGPDKDQSDSLPGFLRPASLPTPDGQEIYSVAWLPRLTGRDLAGEVVHD